MANTALPSANTATEADRPTVNEVVATTIAASVAQATNLSIATNVANLSISTQLESELPTTNESTITKPPIIQPSAASRNIVNYTTVVGDSVDSIAAKYGLNKDTVKWANNLVTDSIEPGKVLQILPTNGIVYNVKAGDTVEGLATKYKADASRIVLYNDLETSGISAGMRIIIPGATLPTNERPGFVSPRSSISGGYSFIPGTVGNRYTAGNCTWYAYERRVQLGRPVGSFWGNAATWAVAARSSGYDVNKTPLPGAVLQINAYGDGWTYGAGHVAIVESVDPVTKDVYISEMNYGGNYNRVTYRWISAGQAALYNYIH